MYTIQLNLKKWRERTAAANKKQCNKLWEISLLVAAAAAVAEAAAAAVIVNNNGVIMERTLSYKSDVDLLNGQINLIKRKTIEYNIHTSNILFRIGLPVNVPLILTDISASRLSYGEMRKPRRIDSLPDW